MKRIYTLILSFLIFQFSHSQLNGVYSIGAEASDYTTISGAVVDLVENGVSGEVIFNIEDGTYFEQNIVISEIEGVSEFNTITFQSESLNSENVTIDMNNFSNGIIRLQSGASNIRFNHLSFNCSASSSSNASRVAFQIFTTTTNITIENCRFNGISNLESESYYDSETVRSKNSYIVISSGNNITISNNVFLNGGSAIYKSSNNNSPYVNGLNIFNNTFSYTFITPINIYKVTDLNIFGNIFEGTIKHRPIYAKFIDGNISINSNKIFASSIDLPIGQTSIYLIGLSGINGATTDSNIIIKNNFIATKTDLRLFNFKTVDILNNSFYTERGRCLVVDAEIFNTTNDIDEYNIYNNIFSTKNEYPNIAVVESFDLTKLSSDYNAFNKEFNVFEIDNNYTPDEFYSLTDWKLFSNTEDNSLVVDNVYASETELHTPNAFMLNGTGLNVGEVSLDIDGETRSSINPDRGADEFDINFDTYLDLEITAINSPNNSICETSLPTITVKNNCNTSITSFDIECALNNYRGNVSSYNLNIEPNEEITVILSNCEITPNTYFDKMEFFVSNPNNELDNNYSNTHLFITSIFQLGDFEINVEENECENAYTLRVPIITGTSIQWSTGESSNEISVTDFGIYTVTLTDSQGCSINKSIEIN